MREGRNVGKTGREEGRGKEGMEGKEAMKEEQEEGTVKMNE